jgi:hypothetical protein
MRKYLRKLNGALHDADLVGVEFLLMLIVAALAMLVALGVESLVWKLLGG